MTNKSLKIVWFCIGILFSLFSVLIILWLIRKNDALLYGSLSSLIGAVILTLITVTRKLIVNLYVTLFEPKYNYSRKYKNELIRLSYAYLIKIRVNNRYLLIKSKNIKDVYQPVGGVFHIEDNSYISGKLGFERDSTPGDQEDIRGTIKGKNIAKFDKWFNKGKGVEKAPIREFKEELIDTGLLDKELFSEEKTKFGKIKTVYSGIKDAYYSNHKYELLRFEIYELFLTKEQLGYIKSNKCNKQLYFASANEIKTLGVDDKHNTRRFGTQTPYILEEQK